MKKTLLSRLSWWLEMIVLIAPPIGYAIYSYCDTLQYTMSRTSQGTFWAVLTLLIGAIILYKGIIVPRYQRYVAGYVQQKTDLETHPNEELLIKKVAEKQTIVENFDYIIAVFPVVVAITILFLFRDAIDKLLYMLEIIAASLAAKICLHTLIIALQKKAMLDNIGGEDK